MDRVDVHKGWAMEGVGAVVRHRFVDDRLAELLGTTPIRQVVLMAAGLDTRAYRLSWPAGTQLFELDQEQVFAHKDAVLAAHGAEPTCDRRVVAVDLAGGWSRALVSTGFDASQPAVWIAEGLLFYLPEAAAHRLLAETYRLSAGGSHLVTDLMSATPGPPQQLKDFFASLGAPFVFATDDPTTVVRSVGWSGDAITMADVARRVGTALDAGGWVVLAEKPAL